MHRKIHSDVFRSFIILPFKEQKYIQILQKPSIKIAGPKTFNIIQRLCQRLQVFVFNKDMHRSKALPMPNLLPGFSITFTFQFFCQIFTFTFQFPLHTFYMLSTNAQGELDPPAAPGLLLCTDCLKVGNTMLNLMTVQWLLLFTAT